MWRDHREPEVVLALYRDALGTEDLRGQEYGSQLLEGAERFAAASGGVAVHLDTDGDETLAFYRKRGYEVFGTLEGFPPGTPPTFSAEVATRGVNASGREPRSLRLANPGS